MKINTTFFSFILIFFTAIHCNPKKSNTSEKDQSIKQSYVLEKVWATDSLLKTPESVIYDKDRDILYVSNVNENPWEKDGNGFISKLSTSGKILDLEWVSRFNGPKGMAIVENILYVADLDEIGLIDIEKGEVLKIIKVEGASGLNDITPDKKGGVFISDSNGGKIYQYSGGDVSTFHEDAPGRPNGLFVDQGKLLVAFSEAADFVSYDPETKEKSVITSGIGHGDGITPTNEKETYLVSDWQGEIFIITPDGNKQSLLKTKDQGQNTADIWFILEKELLLVPTFFDNRVVAYKLVRN
jgi:sugar lactone lactonase YvrE